MPDPIDYIARLERLIHHEEVSRVEFTRERVPEMGGPGSRGTRVSVFPRGALPIISDCDPDLPVALRKVLDRADPAFPPPRGWKRRLR